jgi:NADH-quinone oxidoreductase subunit M
VTHQFPYLSTIIFIPAAGAVLLLLFWREWKEAIRWFALIVSLVTLGFSVAMFAQFDGSFGGMQFVERHEWIPTFGIEYFLGVDGISLFLVLLTTLLQVICILCSWRAITERVKEYMIVFLLLETGMLGVFLALDLVLFYIFWEAMLIPMYLLIGVWGGPRRIYAAIKFFIYTMVGSVLMLLAILYLHWNYAENYGVFGSFNLLEMYRVPILAGAQVWPFLAFGLAFAIKVPMFPFHTWLPDAHVEAPTAGSVVLAGILLKMGTYGFLRFCLPLFPDASVKFVPLISVLAIIGIIYGAIVAAIQPDWKKLVAYSSVSHLGFVMLGLFAFNLQAMEGSVLQMINHGISTGALFLIVGVIYERCHRREIASFGGLWKQLPVFAAIFMIITLSSIGLPGLNGFIGEFLILVGVFKTNVVYCALAATGVVLAAVYMLWAFQRIMFGPLDKPENKTLKDLNPREIVYLVPLVLLAFWIGLFPTTLTKKMEPAVETTLMIMSMRSERQEATADPSTGLRTSRRLPTGDLSDVKKWGSESATREDTSWPGPDLRPSTLDAQLSTLRTQAYPEGRQD